MTRLIFPVNIVMLCSLTDGCLSGIVLALAPLSLLLDILLAKILNPSTDCSPVNQKELARPRVTGCKGTHKKPSCRRNNARLVPLLQNLIAYDSVLIVAA